MKRTFELHFELEPNCFLNCIHCSSQTIRSEEMKYEEKDILRLIKCFKTPLEVFFTGGEPLLYSRLLPLFSEITSQVPTCKIGLFTSGIIYNQGNLISVEEDYLKKLKSSGLEICYVSLYSNEETWHDYMTNQAGSFSCTVRSIKNMIKIGIDTRINLVLTAFNHSHINEIIQFAYSLGVSEVRLLKLICHGNAVNFWKTIGLSNEDYLHSIKEIYAKRNKQPLRITVSSVPQLAPCRPLENAVGCQAGSNLLYVTLSGDVYPCACVKNQKDYLLFNVKDIETNYSNTDLYFLQPSNCCLSERSS